MTRSHITDIVWPVLRAAHELARPNRFSRIILSVALLSSGCVTRDEPLDYPHDEPVQFYRDHAEQIDFPDVCTSTPDEIAFSVEPHTVLSQERSEPWDMTLAEAVSIALHNNRVIRSAGQFLSPGNTLLTNGSFAPSVHDPAIQETGVLFGGRGVEAALAAFDANFTTSALWGSNEQVQNNPFLGGGLTPGGTLTTETAAVQANLSKNFANGGQLQLGHQVNYLWSDAPGQLFPSVYTGNINAQYRHPLLAGSGTEFTRIAGPIGQSFGGLSGVTQGVVIARINNDISIADFENSVRNLVKDVEDTYWDLYLTYRIFDTAVSARSAALATWRYAKIRVDLGGDIDVAAESQARDQYWAAQAAVNNSRNGIYSAETRLRRLLGLPINEGKVIRPLDEPVTAEYLPDWQCSMAEALTHRVELRKQKWNIKSLELQLTAARSLTRPRLDFVSSYQVNGFGDNLLQYGDRDSAGTAQGLNSFYETITQGSQTGWGLGFELSMPIGFRQAHAQVRNIELRLAKAQEVLYVQEMEVGHELANAFQELTRSYSAAQSLFSRRDAAIDNVRTVQLQQEGEIITIDEVLRAQDRRAQAEAAFFTTIVDYNKALTNLHYRKGTLLADANVHLLEDEWDPDAYVDAYRRAQSRTGSVPAPYKHTEPPEFALDGPLGGVEFAHPPTETRPVEFIEEIPFVPEAETVEPVPLDDGAPLTNGPNPFEFAPEGPAANDPAGDILGQMNNSPDVWELDLGNHDAPNPDSIEQISARSLSSERAEATPITQSLWSEFDTERTQSQGQQPASRSSFDEYFSSFGTSTR
ncbi:MAG: TolC family protein [Planctomycetaceae bacterium]|nr:TolC family protein [Planctomycetaceae bacterium]